jgi:hypothetical protein
MTLLTNSAKKTQESAANKERGHIANLRAATNAVQ